MFSVSPSMPLWVGLPAWGKRHVRYYIFLYCVAVFHNNEFKDFCGVGIHSSNQLIAFVHEIQVVHTINTFAHVLRNNINSLTGCFCLETTSLKKGKVLDSATFVCENSFSQIILFGIALWSFQISLFMYLSELLVFWHVELSKLVFLSFNKKL